MREIVTIQIGQAGNQIGCKFWEVICQEHGVTPVGSFCGDCNTQLGSAHVFFQESYGNRFVPRAVLVDLDSASLDTCRCSPYGQIFRPDNFVFGRAGSGNNFAKGRFTEGVDLMDSTLDILRRETEACEFCTGFQIIHAVGGGTGSGVGSLLLERLDDEYTKKVVTTHTVFPSAKVSETVVEPYNTVLALPYLIKYSDMTLCFDNEALYNICHNVLRLSTPSYEDINHIISVVISGATSSMRFPGVNNTGLRKLKHSLVPYPELHFLIPGYAPLSSRGVQPYRSLSLQDVVSQMLDGSTMMSSVDPRSGKYISASAIFRGCIPDGGLDQMLCNFSAKNSDYFVEWAPNYFTKSVSCMPSYGPKISATFLANNTCITGMWKRIQTGYRNIFKRKAFLHWYYGEGMSENDFKEAEAALDNLIKKYKEYETALPVIDADGDDDDDNNNDTRRSKQSNANNIRGSKSNASDTRRGSIKASANALKNSKKSNAGEASGSKTSKASEPKGSKK